MLLAIDVGNTSTSFGLFEDGKLRKRWSEDTRSLRVRLLAPRYQEPGLPASGSVIVSSVVPSADKIIKKRFPKACFITASNIKGIKVKAERREVGADRVVNALAAKELHGTPAIIVDFGTATTFDVISKKGEYWGGAIAPGIGLSSKVLHDATAKLPKISLHASKKLIGKNTRDAINSGLLYGYVSMVEGMIRRIKSHLSSPASHLHVIATGGYAKLIKKYTKAINVVDSDLTLKGLCLAWDNRI